MAAEYEGSNGVMAVVADRDPNVIVLAIPRDLLANLQQAWLADDAGATDFTQIVTAVRDLFEGRDGELQLLTQLGISSR